MPLWPMTKQGICVYEVDLFLILSFKHVTNRSEKLCENMFWHSLSYMMNILSHYMIIEEFFSRALPFSPYVTIDYAQNEWNNLGGP